MENPQGKPGLNVIRSMPEIKCYRCDQSGHMKDDKKCPTRNKECLKCHKVGHFAKCCKANNITGPFQKHPSKSKEHKRTVNQMNFEEHSNSDSNYAFSIVDEKQPIISVNIGHTPNIFMITHSGPSCNVVDHQLWEFLKQQSEMYYF